MLETPRSLVRSVRMEPRDPEAQDRETHAVGRVSRLTGVSPDLLRAWERRYRAVEPIRTPGGTRRYRTSDIERLRLLKTAVEAGYRIGEVARLTTAELEARLAQNPAPEPRPIDQALAALDRLDTVAAEGLISAQLAALGPTKFAKTFALPLIQAIGEGWERRTLCIASEHLGSALLRSLLGSALRTTTAHRDAPAIVFGTLPGERHEIGLLIAAHVALGAGANPVYLGAELPVEELVAAARLARAAAVALSAVLAVEGELEAQLEALRSALPRRVELWIGGAAAVGAARPEGVVLLDSLSRLEQRVELLRIAQR